MLELSVLEELRQKQKLLLDGDVMTDAVTRVGPHMYTSSFHSLS